MTKGRYEYGIITAVSLVVGSVIGSGVFFKTEYVNRITDGDIRISLIAWTAGALVMILCLLAFAKITGKYGSEGGLYKITKNMAGERYSHFIGFFMATVYYPSLVSVLSYLTAKYTLLTFGEERSFLCFFLSFFFLAISFLQNSYSPNFSGRIQIVTTFIKLIPLFLMIILGIPRGELPLNLANKSLATFRTAFFPSVTATLFAYEGWISATSVGKNLKNPHRNLPRALIVGGVIITAVYIFYYLGIMGAVSSRTLINYGTEGIKIAFSNILGRWGALLSIFVAISCYGALNALVMGCANSVGEIFEKRSQTPYFTGFIISLFWIFYLFGEQGGALGRFSFDSTELPVVTAYALYIPIFLSFAKSEKNLKTTILCIGGICASSFAVLCGVLAHMGDLSGYLTMLLSIFLLSTVFRKKR